MKKLVLLVLALAVTSCAVPGPRGSRIYLFPRGINLQLVHLCTDRAIVYQAGRGRIAEVLGAVPFDTFIDATWNSSSAVSVTVQSMKDDAVVGTYTQEFHMGQYSGTQTWTIGNTGSQGGGRHTRCR